MPRAKTVRVAFYPERDGYSAIVLNYLGVSSQGETIAATKRKIAEAFQAMNESGCLKEGKADLPPERHWIESVKVG